MLFLSLLTVDPREYNPDGALGKNSAANAEDPRDMGSIPRSGRSPGVGNGNLLHYFCQENSMGRGAWMATVQGVAKSNL